MVKVRNSGITMNVPENEVGRYERAGYTVVEEVEAAPVAETKTPSTPAPTGPTIGEIYELCDKAGVNPDELVLGNNPTLKEVKDAIKVAKAARAEKERLAKEAQGQEDAALNKAAIDKVNEAKPTGEAGSEKGAGNG